MCHSDSVSMTIATKVQPGVSSIIDIVNGYLYIIVGIKKSINLYQLKKKKKLLQVAIGS